MLFSKFLSNRPGSTVHKPVESFAGHSAPFALKRLAFAVLFACAVGSTITMPSQAYAAGLGRLNVQSGLGQPLRAEVEVTSASPEELQSLQVKLASGEAFKQAGIDVNPALLGINLAVEQRGSRAFVRMSTSQPLNEPYVDLLLELSWSSGRLVREYTFLLDPPELKLGRGNEPVQPAVGATRTAPTTAPVAAQPVPQATATPTPEPTAPAARAGKGAKGAKGKAPAEAPAATAKPEPQTGDYTIKRGDTLGKVADQMRPEGVTLDQMLVSLFRNNPDAFAGNMNRMKTGAVLRAPDAAQAAAVNTTEAHKIVAAQTADFAAYRARLANGVAAGATKAPQGDERTASGSVTAKVEDQTAKPSGDQVKLARPQDAGTKTAAGTPTTSANAARADELAAKDKALVEARQRIAELERNVTDLRGLVSAQTKVGADAQKAAEAKKAEDAKKAEEARLAEAAKKAEADKLAAEQAKKAQDASKATVVDANKPAEATPPAAQPAAVETPKPAEPVKPAPKVEPAPAPVQPAPEGDSLLTNPLVLGGGAALVALLGAYALYSRSRKKRFEKFQDSILTGGDLKTNSIFGTTGGQTVDTTDSTFNSNFTPSASQIDSNEVDPIAEADVYIAYGRDAQAEEILKEALKTLPDRHAIRVKLLEIYASRRDLPAFESVAGELYSRTGGHGDDWEKAAALGRSLDPRNPLYGGSSDAVTATATGVGALAAGGAVINTNAMASSVVAAPEPSVDVDFDLDLDPDHHEPLKESTPVDFELGQPPHDDFLNRTTPSMDFSPTVPVPRGDGTDRTANAPSIDFDLGEEPAQAQAVAAFEPEPVLAHPVAPDTLDFDLDLPEPIEPAAPRSLEPPPPALDLSGISLDLGGAEAAAAPIASVEPAADTMATTKQQEMATKLDLAAAYQEIGDREGAQELLDEVVRGGDATQQARARQMLEAMG